MKDDDDSAEERQYIRFKVPVIFYNKYWKISEN